MYKCANVCSDFTQMLAQAEELMHAGYQRHGNWSLGQICEHLARAVEGSAKPASSEWNVPFSLKLKLVVMKFLLLNFHLVPEKVPAPEGLDILDPVDDQAGIEHLAGAVCTFEKSDSVAPLHRILGPFSKDEWKKFHLVHAAMHMRFLEKKQG